MFSVKILFTYNCVEGLYSTVCGTEVYGHVLTNMESMIHYFKLVTESYTLIELESVD